MLSILLVAAVAVVGLIVFLVSRTNPDAKEIGRCLMWCGTAVTLLVLAGKTVHLP
jgi:ABC-type siderophore export system fused ATPase/permease subunit